MNLAFEQLRTEQSPLSPAPRPRTPADDELAALLASLSARPPSVSPRWFYDSVGSALFEAITRLPEYYPTRTELEIIDQWGPSIAKALGPGLTIIELGSGSADKIGRLLKHLDRPRAYHPVDISRTALEETERAVRRAHGSLEVRGWVGDFTSRPFLEQLLEPLAERAPLLVFFPGGTLGNFQPRDASALLGALAQGAPPGTALLLGVDLIKPASLLEAAYDDPVGVTAAFNRNLLAHLNHHFGADFEPESWRHRAHYDPDLARVEMWLFSEREQVVTLAGHRFRFARGEGIHTENSYKYDRTRLARVARDGGFPLETQWTDARGWFCEALLRTRGGP